MQIDIIADITCPWCFVGLKRIRKALTLRPEITADLRWRPFLLSPGLQNGATDRTSYLSRLFGSESRIQQYYEAVNSAGLTTGIPFSAEVDFTPSSINAHRLISLATETVTEQSTELAEEIFYAYFVEGRDIGDVDVLSEIAEEIGMNVDTVRHYLQGDIGRDRIFEDNARIHRLGINGVPSFVFLDKNVVSGAQEVRSLVHLIDFAAKISYQDRLVPAITVKTQRHGIGTPYQSFSSNIPTDMD